jgi:acetolactate synthase-1/2/3 large subunit
MQPLCRSGRVPIQLERLCREITRMLPENAVFVVDTGFAGIWAGTLVDLNHAGQTFLRAAGSLGWAFPAALGAKCAAPDRPVVCFTGDGGFWYHLSELETAVRCGIKTITIVNNNHSFGQTIDIIQGEYGGRPGNEGDLYLLKDVNFAEIAKAVGGLGIRVTRPDDLADAFSQALASDLPAVIDVVTDIGCRAPAPWRPEGGRHEIRQAGE